MKLKLFAVLCMLISAGGCTRFWGPRSNAPPQADGGAQQAVYTQPPANRLGSHPSGAASAAQAARSRQGLQMPPSITGTPAITGNPSVSRSVSDPLPNTTRRGTIPMPASGLPQVIHGTGGMPHSSYPPGAGYMPSGAPVPIGGVPVPMGGVPVPMGGGGPIRGTITDNPYVTSSTPQPMGGAGSLGQSTGPARASIGDEQLPPITMPPATTPSVPAPQAAAPVGPHPGAAEHNVIAPVTPPPGRPTDSGPSPVTPNDPRLNPFGDTVSDTANNAIPPSLPAASPAPQVNPRQGMRLLPPAPLADPGGQASPISEGIVSDVTGSGVAPQSGSSDAADALTDPLADPAASMLPASQATAASEAPGDIVGPARDDVADGDLASEGVAAAEAPAALTPPANAANAAPAAPAPPQSARDALRQAADALRVEVERGGAEPRSVRLLQLLEAVVQDADVNVPPAGPQDFWQPLTAAVAVSLTDQTAAEPDQRRAAALRHIRAAGDALRRDAALELSHPTFCTQIDDYGMYAALKSGVFKPNQELLLYVEVDNFQHAEVAGSFEVEFHGSYRIVDSLGNEVEKLEFLPDKQAFRRPRRDYYIPYRLYLPKDIARGEYELQLTIEDVKGHKSAQTSIPFRVQS